MSNRIGDISNSRIENLIQLTIAGKLDGEAREDIAAILSGMIKESKHFCRGCQKELPYQDSFLDRPYCNSCIREARIEEAEAYRKTYIQNTQNKVSIIFMVSALIAIIFFYLTRGTDNILLLLMPVVIFALPSWAYTKFREDIFDNKCIAYLDHHIPFHN